MNMPGMVLSKADAKSSKDGFYETKANFGMAGEWEVTVVVRRPGQKDIQEKFKVVRLSSWRIAYGRWRNRISRIEG